MDDQFNTVIAVFKQSFKPGLVLRFGLVSIVSVILSLIAVVSVFLLGAVVLSPFLSNLPSDPIVLIGALLQVALLVVALVLLGFILLILLLVLIESFIEGALLALAKEFLSGGKASVGSAFSTAGSKFFAIFRAKVLVQIVIFSLYLILMIPVFMVFGDVISSVSAAPLSIIGSDSLSAQMVSLDSLSNNISYIFSAIALLLSPVLLLIVPLIMFENLGAIAAVKRAFSMAKTNYFGNLLFVFIVGLFSFAAVIAWVILFLILLVLFILLSFLGIAGVILGIILIVLFVLALMFWAMTFNSLAIVRFYEFAKDKK